eukprot:TRINITY_DN80446_c0_g1_i1.p1 TRINITY_DN80446_c0_g1~~TRINITY_DN80446_c0_g1_i1.p1  ORF type:complete len:168 (+),score=55.78 TRINITY_DN80446_c0_g1_i1:28-504(+)
MAATPEDNRIVEEVKNWFMCTEMEALVQTAVQFADANCAIFEPELGEHKLEYTRLHNEFKQLFEERLNGFLATIGTTPEAFYAAFEKCAHTESASCMADLMYTCLQYEFFCQIMCERKRELEKEGAVPAAAAGPGSTGYGGVPLTGAGYGGPPSAPPA